MPSLEAESAAQQTDLPFHTWGDADGPDKAFAELLHISGAMDAKSIVLDEPMRADFAGLVQDALPDAKRQFTATTVGALRMRKDADEYVKLKRNALSADTAMKAAWFAMKTGMTETQVADIIRDSFASQDVKPLFAIIGAGGNGAFQVTNAYIRRTKLVGKISKRVFTRRDGLARGAGQSAGGCQLVAVRPGFIAVPAFI